MIKTFTEKRGACSPRLHHSRQPLKSIGSLFFLLVASTTFGYTVEQIRSRVRGADIYYYDADFQLRSRTFYGQYQDVLVAFKTENIAVQVSPEGNGLIQPDIDDINYLSTNSFSTSNTTRPIFDLSERYYRVSTFEELPPIFKFCQALWQNGYRGAGFVSYNASGNPRINFNYSLAVADIASSTNLVFHQLLLSHLSSIHSAIVSIDTGVSQLQPVLGEIKDINTSISNSAEIAASSLVSIESNTVKSLQVQRDIADFLPSLTNSIDVLHSDNLAASLDVALGDDTQSWLDFLNWSVEQGYILGSDAQDYAAALQATDPQRKGRSYSIPDAHRRFFVKNQIKHSCVEAIKMRGRYQSFFPNLNTSDSFGNGVANAGALFNDSVIRTMESSHNAATDWRERVSRTLQEWKTSDATGYLNVKKGIDDVGKAIEDNFVTKSANPHITNNIPYTAFVTNNIVVPITNKIDDAQSNISSNIQDAAGQTRDMLGENFDRLFDSTAPGINVRIIYPHTTDMPAVKVHDEGIIMAGAGIDQLNLTATDILSNLRSPPPTNSFDWSEWFDRWDPYATNSLYMVNKFIANESFSVRSLSQQVFGGGFNDSLYSGLSWFDRTELLLYQITKALTSSNSVDTADIEDGMDGIVESFKNSSTNLVTASERIVGNFGVIKRFAQSVQLAFQNSAAPVTDGITVLPAGEWIGNEALHLDVDLRIQNALRVFFTCFWYLLSIVIAWRVVSFAWDKAITFLRWLWSVFDI